MKIKFKRTLNRHPFESFCLIRHVIEENASFNIGKSSRATLPPGNIKTSGAKFTMLILGKSLVFAKF
jgi:hypothetical protein